MNLRRHWTLLLAALLLGINPDAESSGLDIAQLQSTQRFATWSGIEPDKWATLWLIKRHLSPDAYFLLHQPGAKLPEDAALFGVPDAALRRVKGESMFRRLKRAMQLQSPALEALDQVVQDIEVNIWETPVHSHSPWFESMFRQLQARYGRDQVPVDCYLSLFDAAAALLPRADATPADYQQQLSMQADCQGLRTSPQRAVAQLDHLQTLREISLGIKVVFVDTREEEEFDEVHLPGALQLRLRDVSPQSIQPLLDADLVIPYCVKDFRGFEVASAMRRLGLRQVATLSPNGLKGWLQAGLPVVRPGESGERQASADLMRCAMEPSLCIKEKP